MSIGTTLAQARESAGLTVEAVAGATRIRATLLRGIENDDFSACGGDFYARGHVLNVARHLGVDPAPLLAEFDATRTETTPARGTEVFSSQAAARPERRGPNWSAAMVAALVLVAVLGVVRVVGGSDPGTPGAGGPAATGAVGSDAATSDRPPSGQEASQLAGMWVQRPSASYVQP